MLKIFKTYAIESGFVRTDYRVNNIMNDNVEAYKSCSFLSRKRSR
jgi:hypothetical protein